MPSHEALVASSPLVALAVTTEDWDAADGDLLLRMFGQMVWIRAFEEYVLDLSTQGLVHGPLHSSIGQEGGAVGAVLALRGDDLVNGSHRGHHSSSPRHSRTCFRTRPQGCPS